eukprot:4223790-Pyramimonas_sp.AAC.1
MRLLGYNRIDKNASEQNRVGVVRVGVGVGVEYSRRKVGWGSSPPHGFLCYLHDFVHTTRMASSAIRMAPSAREEQRTV